MKDTFTDDSVVTEMKDFLVAHIDVESESGQPVAKRFGVGPLPTLLFLSPDGSVRDALLGYRKPLEFKAEVARIRKDQGTIGDLQRQVDAAPKDIDKRVALANKLKQVNDLKAYEAQVAAVLAIDPERKNPKTAELAFEALMTRVEALWQDGETENLPALIRAHLAQEKNPDVLFRGWATLANIHEELGRMAAEKRAGDAAAKHAVEALTAKKEAWKHVPDDMLLQFGGQLGWSLWEDRASHAGENMALALDIARKLHPKAEEAKDAGALDTVACLYFMNGKKTEAIAALQKAIELDPDNDSIRTHLKEFGG